MWPGNHRQSDSDQILVLKMLQIEQSIPQIYVRLWLSWIQIEAQNGKTSFESAKGFLQEVATKNHFRGPD